MNPQSRATQVDLCECGHPLSSHRQELSVGSYPVLRCAATVYTERPHGDDARPCLCADYREAQS